MVAHFAACFGSFDGNRDTFARPCLTYELGKRLGTKSDIVVALLSLGFYDPVVVLLGMATVTVVGGLAHCGYLAQRQTVSAS